MARAKWNGAVLAESDTCKRIEGNLYFPASSINRAHLEESEHTSFCGWKGKANYYHVVVDGERNDNAAWYYAEPKQAAKEVEGCVAFWRGVVVEP
jgi:uncharacterized protein (DUF427 family)